MAMTEKLLKYAEAYVLNTEFKSMYEDMRAEVSREFREGYESAGVKSVDVFDGDEKSASMTWVPDKEPEEQPLLIIENRERFNEWAIKHGFFKPDTDACFEHFKKTGEIPDGAIVGTKYVGGRAGYVRVKVEDGFKRQVTGRARAMLGGAE
jgi:hypothetical protein